MGSFRIKGISLFVICTLVLSLSITGCGKKEGSASTAKGASTSVKASQSAAKQEVPSVPSTAPITEERTFYDFESNLNGWEVPMWALGKTDHVAQNPPLISKDVASHGEASMKIMTDFPGGKWAAGLVEIQQFLDISSYRVIMLDVYLPADAPEGLKGKIILTVGNNWKFVEMSQAIPLVPGEWTTVLASIEPGSYDWKRVVPDKTFAEDVRKIAIRIVSNNKPIYAGPIYIDNIRVGK